MTGPVRITPCGPGRFSLIGGTRGPGLRISSGSQSAPPRPCQDPCRPRPCCQPPFAPLLAARPTTLAAIAVTCLRPASQDRVAGFVPAGPDLDQARDDTAAVAPHWTRPSPTGAASEIAQQSHLIGAGDPARHASDLEVLFGRPRPSPPARLTGNPSISARTALKNGSCRSWLGWSGN
jgi:hypothetical protein